MIAWKAARFSGFFPAILLLRVISERTMSAWVKKSVDSFSGAFMSRSRSSCAVLPPRTPVDINKSSLEPGRTKSVLGNALLNKRPAQELSCPSRASSRRSPRSWVARARGCAAFWNRILSPLGSPTSLSRHSLLAATSSSDRRPDTEPTANAPAGTKENPTSIVRASRGWNTGCNRLLTTRVAHGVPSSFKLSTDCPTMFTTSSPYSSRGPKYRA